MTAKLRFTLKLCTSDSQTFCSWDSFNCDAKIPWTPLRIYLFHENYEQFLNYVLILVIEHSTPEIYMTGHSGHFHEPPEGAETFRRSYNLEEVAPFSCVHTAGTGDDWSSYETVFRDFFFF